MIKEAMQFIEAKVQEAAKFAEHKIGGRTFYEGAILELKPLRAMQRDVSTLEAIIKLVNDRVDVANDHRLVVHVQTPTMVSVTSTLDPLYRDLELFAVAAAPTRGSFPFGRYLDPDEFVIRAKTHFADSEALALILQIAGSVKEERVLTVDDDGVSQTVMAKSGLKFGRVEMPSHVRLAPFRTFAEVDQPESSFIFRARGGGEDQLPSFALFEVDDGAWYLEAIDSIRNLLAAELVGDNVDLIA